MMHPRRSGGGLGFGILLLAAEVFRVGIPNIPPVTLGFIALNSAIYLRILRVVRDVSKACVSFRLVWQLGQWKRVFLASFFHLDSMHLYFNMVSFLWKGRTLERRFGSRKFFIIIMLFAVLSQMLMLFMNRFLSIFLWNSSYITTCAAGFSAVIFGLKVLTTQNMWQESVTVLGLPITVPAQFACWIELVLIKILVPNSSLVGHLAGIIVGMAFVEGPLRALVDKIDRFIGAKLGDGTPAAPRAANYPTNQASYTYRSGTTGYRTDQNNRSQFDGFEQQQIQEAIRRSLFDRNQATETTSARSRHQQPPNPSYGWNIQQRDNEEGDVRDNGPYPPLYAPGEPDMMGQSRSEGLPYPVNENDRMPYPDQYQHGGIYPDLLGFEQMGAGEVQPSAPPIDRPDLFTVD